MDVGELVEFVRSNARIIHATGDIHDLIEMDDAYWQSSIDIVKNIARSRQLAKFRSENITLNLARFRSLAFTNYRSLNFADVFAPRSITESSPHEHCVIPILSETARALHRNKCIFCI